MGFGQIIKRNPLLTSSGRFNFSTNNNSTLPETGTLPSAGSFAECILQGTRQRRLCRVFFSALGKDVFCRVPFFGTRQNASLPSAFFWHSAKMYFAECHFLALGKIRLCRVPFFGTRQRGILQCAFFCLRQIIFSKQFLRPEMNSNEKLFNYKVV